MTQQPTTPPEPPVPPAPAMQAAAQRMAVAAQKMDAAARQMDGAPAAAVGVVRDPGGRIVVTGPNGKTVTIDPKAGLDGDQIQELVQATLEPTPGPSRPDEVPRELIPIFGIIFPCLAAMVFFVTRMFAARRVAPGSTMAVLPPETVARLARIEQAMDSVAIEVERISEAQRYSAQLLTDRLPGAGQPLPAIARTLDAPIARG